MTRRPSWLSPLLAALAAIAVLTGPTPAGAAAPSPAPSKPSANESDPHADEGSPKLLSEAVEQANRNYVLAKAKLDKTQQRQKELAAAVAKAQQELDRLAPEIQSIVDTSYRMGRAGPAAMLLNSSSKDDFVRRAAGLEELNQLNDQKIATVNEARKRAEDARAALDAQVREEQRLTATMARQKQEVEKSLSLLGGNRQIGSGFVAATSPVAKAAPRSADGSFPSEGCTKDDPTTDGCITGRTLNAYTETRKAGFNRFAGCHRNGGPFEHPKGRACDWSLINKGFVRAQNKDQLLYGNNLAAFLIRNADRLGIYYVIWYKQIWMPATGWASYSGDSDHTDHVHMSML
ncbi:coiled-coil domain-containing protein [Micromonospora zhanjiangensis]|uniref:Coiled-coil domain-containing protein n=1 Tax=Micromonospora zhanjiangensis TaxID=1522057 RepID=A0ABV8KNR6_9ACTN